MTEKFKLHLGDYKENIEKIFADAEKDNVIQRIWDKDYKIWSNSPDEITNRLGWLDSPVEMISKINEINEFVDEVKKEGITHVLLMGMGGSSLAPEVFRLTFGLIDNQPDLAVLDSTDPGAVLELEESIDLKKTLFIVSTKSGGTVETMSFFKYFYNKVHAEVGEKAGSMFTAVTDPGSGLEETAKSLNFRKIFLNNPDIGGRFSALSYFGLVPAAIVGVDIEKLLERTKLIVEESKLPMDKNSSARLGAAIGELAEQGIDKLTVYTSDEFSSLTSWIEQLVAESTGKSGKGILPVEDFLSTDSVEYSKDRVFVFIKLKGDTKFDSRIKDLSNAGYPCIEIEIEDKNDLGIEFFRWEFATAAASWRMKIHPFNQPNVESAKKQAKQQLKEYSEKGKLPSLVPLLEEKGIKIYGALSGTTLKEALKDFLKEFKAGDDGYKGRSYISLQAFIKPSAETTGKLNELKNILEKNHKCSVTVGYGPRFLHSTGQLHKGDSGNGLFIQFYSDMPNDINIPDEPGKPDSSISFGTLKDAQALGDRQALLENNRKVACLSLGEDINTSLNHLNKILS